MIPLFFEVGLVKDNNLNRTITEKVLAPINEKLSPDKRLKRCLALSDLMTRMVTYAICHTIMRLIPHGDQMFDAEFCQQERQIFKTLSIDFSEAVSKNKV